MSTEAKFNLCNEVKQEIKQAGWELGRMELINPRQLFADKQYKKITSSWWENVKEWIFEEE